MNRLYTDVAELSLSLKTATLSRLAATILPVAKLMKISGQINTHLPPGISLLKPVKPENLHFFYSKMRVHAVTFPGTIRLLIKILLKDVQSSYAAYRVIPLPIYLPELQRQVQWGRKEKWFAISADHRSYYELENDYKFFCKFGEIDFCEINTSQMDRSQDSCLSGLYFSKTEKVLKFCEKVILRENFNPVFTRVNTWIYSVNQTYVFELKCQNGSIGEKMTLQGTGWVQQPDDCDMIHEAMTLKAQKTFNSEYTTDTRAIHVPALNTMFTQTDKCYRPNPRKLAKL